MSLMNLIPWRSRRLPVRRLSEPLSTFDEELNAWFDEFFSRVGMPVPWAESRPLWYTPKVDVSESEEAIEVTAELPGMEPDEVAVTLTADSLTIAGEKRQEEEEKRQDYYRMERHYGAFRRVIPLPSGMVDEDKVTSSFTNGILSVTLPKLREAVSNARRIPIQAA